MQNTNLATDFTLRLPDLIECLRQLADVRQREGAYDQALAYLEQGLRALGGEAPQEHPHLWRSILDRLAWVRFRQGQLEEGFSLASTALASLDREEVDDPIRLASLHNTLGGICWQQGKLDEAVAHAEYSLKLYESSGYYWGTAIAYGNLGILSDIRGDWSRAVEYHERAYALQQLIGDLESQARTLDNLGILRMARGEHEAARLDLEASLQIRQRLGDNFGLAQSQASLAQLALIQSRFEDAIGHLQAGLALSNAIGSNEIQVQVRWLLALVHAENREFEVGLRVAQEALVMARTAEFLEGEVDCLRVLGRLHTFTDNFGEAETFLRDSIALANQLDDPYRQSLALLELGRLYQRQAQTDQPHQGKWLTQTRMAFNEAIQKFASLGAAYDLHLAQAALSELG
jgi:tetratricopeptide (TPR) repeat protein